MTMSDTSDRPLFHLTPREVFDLFKEGVWHGVVNSEGAWRLSRERLVDLLHTHAMHKRYEAGNPVYDRDELRRAIEKAPEGAGS